MKSSILLLEAGFFLCPRLLLVSKGPGEIASNLEITSSPPMRFELSGANPPNVSCCGCRLRSSNPGGRVGSEGVVGVTLRNLEVGKIGKAESWDIAFGDGGMIGSVALLCGGETGGLRELIRVRLEGLWGTKAYGR